MNSNFDFRKIIKFDRKYIYIFNVYYKVNLLTTVVISKNY
jgi:hypothetical protein